MEEEIEEKDGDTFEGIMVEVEEGQMLTLDTHHPPRSNEHLGLLLTFGEPSLKAVSYTHLTLPTKRIV